MRAVLFACVFLLVACKPYPTEGAMVSKHHDPARDWTVSVADYTWVTYTVPVSSCSGTGKTFQCTTRIETRTRQVYVGSHLEPRHEDEKWWVEVRDGDGDTGWLLVTQPTWSEAQVGSHVKQEVP